jgi:hypothetical protein
MFIAANFPHVSCFFSRTKIICSLHFAIVISLFCITDSNALHAGSLRGEFLDIMGRKIVRSKESSKKKAFYLDILKYGHISKLVREITKELENFDTNVQEQAVILKNITTLCGSLEVFLERIPCGPYETLYAYPFHAQLAYTMEKQLSEFYEKIKAASDKVETLYPFLF